ncbi:Cell division control protein 6 -like protein [Toxocara canis]|uniref:Cell division control protein 6-like protein n=1 Tax=Toxocara canis TaxID=6265 RepID=A0A0B2VJY4_TOXCA|nr:Cell division control protein 6 -like protein [Toxocara canis]
MGGMRPVRKRGVRALASESPNSVRQQNMKSSRKSESTCEEGASEEIVKMLYGRESEVARIQSELEKCISSSCSMSIYISGPPGTGKTASVRTVLRNLSSRYRLIVISVNCVSVNTKAALLRAMLDKLPRSCPSGSSSTLRDNAEGLLRKADCPVILVLDEIDYVQTKNRGFIYAAFQWPSQFASLAVIAISNSLDLTERELPKLKLAVPPVLLPFAPYSKEDLQRILKNKLSSNNGVDERAVELCSRKVAAMTGDVRHAMQIAQRMLPDVSVSLKECAKRVGSADRGACPQVLGAVTNVYRSSLSRTRIPLQQKVLLATMLRLVDKHRSTVLDKGVLLDAYERVCNMISLPTADTSGTNAALSLLESLSLLKSNAHECQLLIDAQTAIDYMADSTLFAQINNLALN